MLEMDDAGKKRIADLLAQSAQWESAAKVTASAGTESAADRLFAILGATVQHHVSDPAGTLAYAGVDVESGFSSALAKFGKSYFNHVQKALRELTCGKDEVSEGVRKQIAAAFHLGRDAVATSIATAIATFLGIAPAIASVLGVLIVVLFFRPSVEALCDVWKVPAGN